MVPTTGFIILLFPMQIYAFTDNWATILLIMSSFGLALIALTYLISFAFTSSNRAFRTIGALYIVIGFVLPLAITGILAAVSSGTITTIVTAIFYINPFYPFYLSLMYVSTSASFGDDPDIDLSVFFPGFLPYLSRTIPTMLGTAVIYFVLALIIDYKQNAKFRVLDGNKAIGNRPPTLKPDSDVLNEEQNVERSNGRGINNFII